MKFLLLIGVFFSSAFAFSQGISLFNIDPSGFPTIKAKFYAYDKYGKPLRPSIGDLYLKEDGTIKSNITLNCPPVGKPKAISPVLVIDVSGSMGGGNLELAKRAAMAWVDALPLSESECALTTFDNANYLIQDYTQDKQKLVAGISRLQAMGGTNYDEALINPMASGLQVSKHGKNQKVIIFLTDGQANPPRIEDIVNESARQGCMIYSVVLGMPAPESVKEISFRTGGMVFDNVTTVKQAEDVYRRILQFAIGVSPCEISWQSTYRCTNSKVQVSMEFNRLLSESVYEPNERSLIKLTTEPKFLYFGPVSPNSISKKTITLTAVNYDFTISNSKFFGSKSFSIEGISYPFTIPKNTNKELTIVYAPKDKNKHYGFIQPETGICTSGFSVYGGFPGGELDGQTLKLTSHNCGKAFTAGMDTLITWEGIPEDDRVMIEYSADSGMTWSLVTDNATGYKHLWKYPPLPATKNGMLRIQQLALNGIDPRVWTSGFELDAVKDVFSPDNNRIAYIINNNSVTVRDALTGELINTISPVTSGPQPVIAWSGNSSQLAIAKGTSIELIDIFTGVKKRAISSSNGVKIMGINSDGQRLAYGTEDGTVVLVDLSTGRELQRKTGFNFIIGGFVWGADGSFTVTGSCSDTYVMKEEIGIPLQEDYSDCSWTMRAPSMKFKYPVIEMGKVIVGSQRDTVLKNSLCNDGTVPIHILGATITSGDYSQFIATNGLRDIVLNPGDCFNHEFSFQPNTEGAFEAYVTVNTTIGDMHDKFLIKGIGIPPFIKTIAKFIDFGQVELTKPKDSTLAILKNIGSEAVEFDSIVQGGPNLKDFSTTEKIKKFTLAPGESKTLTIRFTPKELGLTNGRLLAYYKGVGSPAMLQLYGEGIPRILPIEQIAISKRDTISVERRGVSEPRIEIGQERSIKILDTLLDKILAIDSTFRTDTLLKPLIVITGSIKAVGVDANNQVVNTPTFKIDLNTSNKYEALLPYIFFDEGSEEIPTRYIRKNASEINKFTIDQLWYKNNTIEIYHEILNIVGKRLSMYPKANLTISGHNAHTGIEKDNKELSQKRAENVKKYLKETWGIQEKRIVIKSGNLPKAKSLPIDEPETAQENRRVEFTSNDSRILEPLDLKNTLATSNPPKVRFNVQGAADFGIASYTIEAVQSGQQGRTFSTTETMSLPNSIDWEIAKDQEITPKLAKPVSCSLTITDKKGNSKVVGTDEMNIDLITVERKIKEHIDGFEVDYFSLILFDFNKSDIENENKKIISAIQKRAKKGSEISIVGTTDRIGTEEYNSRLSQERANAVKTAIKRKNTVASGKGEQELKYNNDLPEGRFYCRTVNVIVKTPIE
jgi:outer membrane protein OmpA-like peptidoglycan-associated protein